MALKTHFLNDKKLPIVFTNTNNKLDIVDWAKSHKEELRTLLSEYGAILFRGFPIHGVEDFERFAEACTSADWVEYLEATSPRDHVKSNTATSTKYDKNRTIFFHNEKSYSSVWPKYLFFYCDVPPNIGGETPLSNCRLVYRDIPDDVRQKFEAKKLMYVRRFSNNMGIPWKIAFNVETREELESYCGRNFIENLSWNDDGTPVLEYCRDTSIVHPDTGDWCWFNHGTFFNVHSLEPDIKDFFVSNFGKNGLPYNTYYGNGEEIEEDVVATLRRLYEEHSSAFPWESRDVLLIDNMLVSHGRRPFQSDRNILVTMTEAVSVKDVISR